LYNLVQEMLGLADGRRDSGSQRHFAPTVSAGVTCHMPKTVQIGEFGRVGSHTMQPVLPGADASEIEPDSCSGCHGDQVTRPALQQFIDDAQAGTSARVAAIEQAAGSDAPAGVMTALDFVGGDGSQGIHNPAYTDALLGAAEIELGLRSSGSSARRRRPFRSHRRPNQPPRLRPNAVSPPPRSSCC
jgi:hypothetical protein